MYVGKTQPSSITIMVLGNVSSLTYTSRGGSSSIDYLAAYIHIRREHIHRSCRG